MKALTLRFSDRSHQAIAEAARLEGVSLSQFLRESALIRAVWTQAAHGGYDEMAVHDLYQRARQILEAEDKRRRPRTD